MTPWLTSGVPGILSAVVKAYQQVSRLAETPNGHWHWLLAGRAVAWAADTLTMARLVLK